MSFIDKLKNIVNPVTQEIFNKEEEPLDTNPLEEYNDIVVELHPKASEEVQELPEYEYEALIKDTRIFHEGTWAPVKTESIKRPENIKKYIQHGMIRKINR
jgi:hypothetical protein